jgi:hypothetical protein
MCAEEGKKEVNTVKMAKKDRFGACFFTRLRHWRIAVGSAIIGYGASAFAILAHRRRTPLYFNSDS